MKQTTDNIGKPNKCHRITHTPVSQCHANIKKTGSNKQPSVSISLYARQVRPTPSVETQAIVDHVTQCSAVSE